MTLQLTSLAWLTLANLKKPATVKEEAIKSRHAQYELSTAKVPSKSSSQQNQDANCPKYCPERLQRAR
jgi:hypothetical protein